jgi:tol-pal system protein YbgF
METLIETRVETQMHRMPHPQSERLSKRPIGSLLPWLLLLMMASIGLEVSAQVRRDDLLTGGGDAALSVRLERLERMLNEQSLSDLVLQIQRLQQEVQELRGQVEVQQYRLQQLGGSRFGGSGFGSSGFGGGLGPDPGSLTDPGLDPAVGEAAEAQADAQSGAGGGAGSGAESGAGPGLGPAEGAGESAAAVTPPPQQGVGALGRGSDDGGLLALPSPETTAGGEREAYREAFEQLKERNYAAAKKAFGSLLVRYPQGQFADNACYWLGEIGYVTKDYPAAMTQFNRLIADFPLSPKLPSAMLKLGYVYSEQNDLEQARRILQEVAERFPDTTEGRLAQGRLAQMTRDGG